MLIGEFLHTIDAKKRLALPIKFRRELGSRVVITRGFENCLVIYPEKEWQGVTEKLAKLPTSQLGARSFSRLILAGAMEIDLDKLGRVLIPDYLKTYAGLAKDVVICGLSNKLEVWDSKKWEEYKKNVEKDIGNVAEKLGEIGI